MLHYPFNVHNSPNLLVHLQQHHFWKTIQIRNSSSKCQVCEDFLWEEQPGYFCATCKECVHFKCKKKALNNCMALRRLSIIDSGINSSTESLISTWTYLGKKPIKCGYLLKKGEKNNKWKVRWCAVIEAKFFYFDQIKDQEPIQSFSLNNLAFECNGKNSRIHKFQLVVETRNYVFAASSEEELLSWMDAVLYLKSTPTSQSDEDNYVL